MHTAERIREKLPPLPLQGVAWGIVAAMAWATYNVGAKVGAAQGFQPADLTLIRFAVAGLIMLPLLVRAGFRDLGGLGWGRGMRVGAPGRPAVRLRRQYRLRPGAAGARRRAGPGGHHAVRDGARLPVPGRAAEPGAARRAWRSWPRACSPSPMTGSVPMPAIWSGWAISASSPPASCGARSPSCCAAGRSMRCRRPRPCRCCRWRSSCRSISR